MTGPPDTAASLLVVEDDDAERLALQRVLQLEGYQVQLARNVREALTHVGPSFQLVISDLRLGQQSGIELLRAWRDKGLATPFIFLTAYGTVETAVEAMKLGALDFLMKPVDPEPFLELVRRCLLNGSAFPVESGDGEESIGLVGQSPEILQLCQQTLVAARTNSTVLILGESGTGKELVAQAIHHHSHRRAEPFVVVNMAALPESLVESELFGHVKGAFTGAGGRRIGRFEAAHGGTLFIDEVGDFPLHMQPKLLRALETRSISPIGGEQDIACDVRVVAATSRPLTRMIADGQFRQDLYYRLNVVCLSLPPLRDRRSDIPLLVDHFLRELSLPDKQFQISPDLLFTLQQRPWPGNVRQLRNCLERMCVLARQPLLTAEDLPADLQTDWTPASEAEESPPAEPRGDTRLDSLERTAILGALRQFDGNRTKAAQFLGISVRTLQRRLRDWGITSGHSDLSDHS